MALALRKGLRLSAIRKIGGRGDPSTVAPSLLPQWTAAKAAQQAGTRNARVLAIGHSGPAGQNSTDAGQGGNCYNSGYPALLAKTRNGNSDIGYQSFFGQGRAPSTNAWNNRLQQGSWSLYNSSSGGTLGGSLFTANAATASALTYTTTVAVNTVEIFYPKTATAASFNVSIDGGANQLISVPATPGFGYGSTKITGLSLAVHSIAFTWVSGTVYPHGVVCSDSTQRYVEMLNTGTCGLSTGELITGNAAPASNGDNYAAAINYLKPDLTLLHLAGNDIINQTSTSAFDTNTRLYASAIRSAGSDLIMVTDIPLKNITPAQRLPYDNIYKQIAADLGVPVVDLNTLWGGDWTVGDGKGWYGTAHDTYHAGPLGHPANAGFINALL